MEQRIQVDFAVLKRVAGQVGDLADEYKGLYTQLKEKVDDLVTNQIWVSDDSLAFREKVNDFTTTDFDKMYNEMLEYKTHLENSASNYETAQENNAKLARGMKSHYNG